MFAVYLFTPQQAISDAIIKNSYIPIIASGGKTEESVLETIEAGANAITYTPPSTMELFKGMMEKYRNNN